MALSGPVTVAEFVRTIAVGPTGRAQRVALFTAVRDLPYATNSASDAIGLIRCQRGSCLAKADLLWHGFRLLGDQVRRVRWRYQLPLWPPDVARLPTQYDVHTAVEVLIGGDWVLVDATHDPPLTSGGLTVAEWDGVHATAPNCAPLGPIWREGVDDAAIAAAIADLSERYANATAEASDYLASFNRWLDSLRNAA